MHEHAEEIGQNVVILGGGLVGCEESILLGNLGKKVTVLEMKPELSCRDAPFLHHEAVLLEMESTWHYGPAPACDVPAFFRMALRQAGRERNQASVDAVIIAAGLAPKLDEAESFRSYAPNSWKMATAGRYGMSV